MIQILVSEAQTACQQLLLTAMQIDQRTANCTLIGERKLCPKSANAMEPLGRCCLSLKSVQQMASAPCSGHTVERAGKLAFLAWLGAGSMVEANTIPRTFKLANFFLDLMLYNL